jgi:hypothetical protein
MFNGILDGNKTVVHADPENRKVSITTLSRKIHKLWWPIGVSKWLPELVKVS